ncbi:hypothetical protein P7K49_026554 [Saguinus oedipus]|uniref:Histidine-rich glycoprotein-like n=1 Tax=Saguinus oedipus TaxID=9490 RepID=A0ABQ9UEW3_SAGOE|nr:hypothetical protein P7K49_026554 [Saguinus oedipus]
MIATTNMASWHRHHHHDRHHHYHQHHPHHPNYHHHHGLPSPSPHHSPFPDSHHNYTLHMTPNRDHNSTFILVTNTSTQELTSPPCPPSHLQSYHRHQNHHFNYPSMRLSSPAPPLMAVTIVSIAINP